MKNTTRKKEKQKKNNLKQSSFIEKIFAISKKKNISTPNEKTAKKEKHGNIRK